MARVYKQNENGQWRFDVWDEVNPGQVNCIIHHNGQTIYVDENGKEYVIYKGVNLTAGKQIDYNDTPHYITFAVENEDGGACMGFWYTIVDDDKHDDELLYHCRRYIKKEIDWSPNELNWSDSINHKYGGF